MFHNKLSYNKLLIASNNSGKVKEISLLLSPYNIEVVSAIDLNIKEPEETGKTFSDNSRLKAEYYGKLMNLPALADDSGLSIDALDGFPGIYTARMVEKGETYQDAFIKIQNKLEQKNLEASSAYFTCSLALWFPDGSLVDFEGRVDGLVSFPARGNNGFGFDPIFTPSGYNTTFAEMSFVDKDKISHRSIAFKKLVDYLFG